MSNIKVVRVQNIPPEQSTDEFRQLLHDAAGPDIQIRADLVPSCTVHDGSQTAIVKFAPRLPDFLKAMADDHVGTKEHHFCLPLGSQSEVYTFDKHFFGMTQLYYSQDNSEIIADIVAVTGLNGRGYDSWRGEHPHGDMWLQNFFIKDLPSARTMIYGYNTKWTSPGTSRTDDFRAGFSLALQNARRVVSSNRPLIFIGHSFGAIIVGQLLMDWKYNDTPFAKSAFQATKALFLFGAPHLGMDIEDIKEMVVAKNAHHRMELLHSLGFQNEQSLAAESKRLTQLSNSFKIFSFYEQRLSNRLAPVEGFAEKYERQGSLFDYVTKESSTLGLPHFLEQSIPVDANHSDLVKFSHVFDQTYQLVLNFIRDILHQAASSTGSPLAAGESMTSNNRSNIARLEESVSGPSHAGNDHVIVPATTKTQAPTDPWMKDQHGRLPIHYTAEYGMAADLMQVYTAANPDILFQTDLGGKTPLHYAAQNGNTEGMNWLLARCGTPRAYIVQQDFGGSNAQDLALAFKHYTTAKVLQSWLDSNFR